AGYLAFGTRDGSAQVERMRIDHKGRVFIGQVNATPPLPPEVNIAINPLTPIDGGAWVRSTVRLGRNLTYSGTADEDPANEFAMIIQANTPASTSSQVKYVKAGLLVEAETQDPSGTITRDMAAIVAYGNIGGTTTTGRAWGINTIATAGDGADGVLIGVEIGVWNDGSPQKEHSTATSKVGLSLVAMGTNHITDAIHINMDPTYAARWYRGIFADVSAFASGSDDPKTFLQLANGSTDVFVVTTSGVITAGTWQGSASARLKPRFESQSTQPSTTAGEMMVWGDTSTGTTYIIFNNGAGVLKVALT
ncbi:MAG: hypothetical protein HY646_22295, partial [Acidobacteria bacterium]|nr:hypothetical protein [Acidobacteriota bacterium]